MSDYDTWLMRQADRYYEPCEPEKDRDGEYTKCIECFSKHECEYYKELFEVQQ